MNDLIERHSTLSLYRRAAAVLLAGEVGLPILVTLLGGPDWLAFIVGICASIPLVLLTYHRLRDAGLSGGWIVLMVIAFNVGPSWDGPGPIHVYASGIVNLIPVLLAFFTPSGAGASPRTA